MKKQYCLLFAAFIISFAAASSSQNLSTDASSLLEFKAQISADPFKSLDNWSSSNSVCLWNGVSCDLQNGRVMALNLSGMSLGGSISSNVGNLTFMTSLDLSNNFLFGSIPDELASLQSLKWIDFGHNNLSGQIPSWVGKLSELEQLSLSYNDFNGSIPTTLGYLTNLKELIIGGNTFSGGIPRELGDLTRLEKLNIQSSSLTGEIPSSIFNISSLRVMDFGRNSLSGSFKPDVFANLPLLEGLRLSHNRFNGPIPSFIWECKSLVAIRFTENNFTGAISPGVANLTSLKILLLDQNSLTGELPSEIGHLEYFGVGSNMLSGLIRPQLFNMSSLLYLDLSENNFYGTLPSTMWTTLASIKAIYLQTNKFSGALPSAISNASQLSVICMTTNQLSGPIPSSLGNLRLLRELYLAENSFTRDESSSTRELEFISSLTKCRELQIVEISRNQFNGFLPVSIGNFSTSLREFSAFESAIMGSIPSEIGNMISLQAVKLFSNELTGAIPSTIGKLSQVDRIYVEGNKLQGHIPTELCQLTRLGDLNLSNNMLSGSIPDCLGDLKSLRRVFLQSNQLTFTIPFSMWNLNDLLVLNLSSNSLSGSLSPTVQNLRALTTLDLSWNDLSGDIPSSVGSSTTLAHLSLTQNRFQGQIPNSLTNLLSLEYLDLSHNNISGRIPLELRNLTYLEYLDLSFNKLEGEIPSGGSFSNFKAESFMQNSALCGATTLQVQSCESGKHSKKSRLGHLERYILTSILCALFISTSTAAFMWDRRRRRRKMKHVTRVQEYDDHISLYHSWIRVSYLELSKATDSFNSKNLLGTGSFGSVFRGMLSNGSTVAIKVFHAQSEGANKSFEIECEALASIRHKNIIKALSCVSSEDFKALVLEYMPNGSLETWLHSGKSSLDMLQRLNVVIDVASALDYLHHYHEPAIVHCDLKPSNILIDQGMRAHLTDFGIAKIFNERESMMQTKNLGTIGYMAPEYGTSGIVSTPGDVYSFGVILLELFTGKSPTDNMFGENLKLRDWVMNSILANSVVQVVDRTLIGQEEDQVLFDAKKECFACVFGVGVDCLSDSPHQRISLGDILIRLTKIRATFSIDCI